MTDPLVIRIDGLSGGRSAFQTINSRWKTHLEARGHTVRATEEAPADPDLTIVHDWTRPFDAPDPVPAGPAVAVRTWDFGPYPRRWVEVVQEHYAELWAGTEWIRHQAIEGGVDPDQVRVVPLGVDLDVFTPPAASDEGARNQRTFLFVGAAVLRKGIDVLLRAWEQAFEPDDQRVRLVIKDHVDDVFYEDQSFHEQVKALAASRPGQVELIDEHLALGALVELYQQAHAFVLPYRAEGFALPVLEAMACGAPPVLPRFGACLDYADDTNAELFEVRRIAAPVRREMAYTTLGFREQVDAIDFAEPDQDTLCDALRRVNNWTPAERAARSSCAVATAQRLGWSDSALAIERAAVELTSSP